MRSAQYGVTLVVDLALLEFIARSIIPALSDFCDHLLSDVGKATLHRLHSLLGFQRGWSKNAKDPYNYQEFIISPIRHSVISVTKLLVRILDNRLKNFH